MLRKRVLSVSFCLLAFVATNLLPAKLGTQTAYAQGAFTITAQLNEGSFQGPGISGATVLLVMCASGVLIAQRALQEAPNSQLRPMEMESVRFRGSQEGMK